VKSETPTGLKVKAIMDAGELVSDEIVSALISDELVALPQTVGLIFDGYPRTQAQARQLDEILAQHRRKIDRVIELAVDEDALVERITGRFTCAHCGAGYHEKFKLPRNTDPMRCDHCGSTEFNRRADDNEESVRTRMAEYRAKTAPILPFYEARGLVSRVDGMAEMDEVTKEIERVLEQ
jgi:adenylate kinase